MSIVEKVLGEEIIARIRAKIRRTRLRHLLLLFLLVASTSWGLSNPDDVRSFAKSTTDFGRIYYADFINKAGIPLDKGRRATLERHTNYMHDQLESYLESTRGDAGVVNAWALGQILTSLQSRALYEAPWARQLFLADMNVNTSAWQEIPSGGCGQGEESVHFPTTYWATYALHHGGYDVSRQVRMVLEAQSDEGFWTAWRIGGGIRKNASTYSTVLATMMLHYVRDNTYLSATLKSDVKSSIKRSVDWLANKATGDNPWLWIDYPHNDAESSISLAASAMAIHVLNIVEDDEIRNVDVAGISAAFLEALPTARFDPKQKEVPGAMIFDEHGMPVIKDSARYYILPWMLIAIRDAYGHGSISGKRRAIDFVERHIDLSPAFATIDVTSVPWIAAEYLIGLKYMQDISYSAGGSS